MTGEIYLDNSASTRVCEASIQAANVCMREDFGNAASLHRKGFEAEQIIGKVKRTIAGAMLCDESEIYFTSGATESNNMSIIGGAMARKRRGNRIIMTAIEHASVIECGKHLEDSGFEVIYLKPGAGGKYSPMEFYNAVDENTLLVSAMFVNNELGTKLPILEIAKAVKRKNPDVLFHTDAVQGFMKCPIKLRNSAIDLMSASGHKISAPKGIGMLYVKNGVRLSPLLFGGGQQKGIRVGTENVPLIAAFGAAVGEIHPNMDKYYEHYKILKAHLLERLKNIKSVSINSYDSDTVPYIVNISVSKIRSEIMLHFLEKFGIYVSSGSACSKGAKSHVLTAYGVPTDRIDTALRISFSPETTMEQITYFTEKLQDGIDTLAKMKG